MAPASLWDSLFLPHGVCFPGAKAVSHLDFSPAPTPKRGHLSQGRVFGGREWASAQRLSRGELRVTARGARLTSGQISVSALITAFANIYLLTPTRDWGSRSSTENFSNIIWHRWGLAKVEGGAELTPSEVN